MSTGLTPEISNVSNGEFLPNTSNYWNFSFGLWGVALFLLIVQRVEIGKAFSQPFSPPQLFVSSIEQL